MKDFTILIAVGSTSQTKFGINPTAYQLEKHYALHAEVSCYQGTESYGNVTFNLTPYKPFTVVESE